MSYEVPTERALGIAALCAKLNLGRATIWRRLNEDPTFPRPISLGGATRRWLESEVDAWLAKCAAARGGKYER